MMLTQRAFRVLAAALAVGLAAPALIAAPDPAREQLEALTRQKSLSRPQIERLLATTPRGFYLCPVGELWPTFENGAPHSPDTVMALLDLYRAQKDRWKRYHLLSALSRERERRLTTLWRELMADPGLPADYRWVVAHGLENSGTDADVEALSRRLGHGADWDVPVLSVLSRRPVPAARPAVLRRFRERTTAGSVRAQALLALVQFGGAEVPELLKEAAADPDGDVREMAAALSKERDAGL